MWKKLALALSCSLTLHGIARAESLSATDVQLFGKVSGQAIRLQKDIWPDADFADRPIALVDQDDQALIIKQGLARVQAKSGYNRIRRDDGFSFRDIDGKPGIVVFCRQIDPSRLLTAYHERFHQVQEALGWDQWYPTGAMSRSPVFPDSSVFVLFMLEQHILNQALLETKHTAQRDLLRDYVSVRTQRLSKMASADVEAELALETIEGTALYLESSLYRSWQLDQPLSGVFTRTELAKGLLVPEKAAIYRFRYYQSGAALALVFDDVARNWKQRLPHLHNLKAVAEELAGQLADVDRQERLAKAKDRYHLNQLEAAYVNAFQSAKPKGELEQFLSQGTHQVRVRLRKGPLHGSGNSAPVPVAPQQLLFASGSRFFMEDPVYTVTVSGACLLDTMPHAGVLQVMENLKLGDLRVDGRPVPISDGVYEGRLEITGASIVVRAASARAIISGNTVTID